MRNTRKFRMLGRRKLRPMTVVTMASLASLVALDAGAGEADAFVAAAPPLEESLCDKVFGLATLYDNKDNPVIQKLAFTGRAQFDYAVIDGEGFVKGGYPGMDISHDDFNIRRLRAGFKATLFEDFVLHGEADFDPEDAPWYQRLTDLYVAWNVNDALTIKAGKQSMAYTLDGKTSSKKLVTVARNALTANLWFSYEYLPGVSAGGEIGNWSYKAGVFSKGGRDKELGEFNAGAAYLASVGYDFSEHIGADKAMLAVDYMYNEEKANTGALFTNRNLRYVVSLNGIYERGPWGMRGDLAIGDGFQRQSDLWGLVLMPYYNINDYLQVVFRYTFVKSDRVNGVRFGTSYESESLFGPRGDEYNEAMLGLNWYICEHKLKLQTGLQYNWMRDRANDGGEFEGWAWLTGLRISW